MSPRVLQLPPRTGNTIRVRTAVPDPWHSLPKHIRAADILAWSREYDRDFDDRTHGGFDWNGVLGVALVLGVSFAFWAGLGWLALRLFR